MKNIFLITISLFFSCSNLKKQLNSNDALYFYFDASHQNEMVKYYSYKDGPINYLYKIANIIFTEKNKTTRNKPNRIKISSKDTVNLDLKHFKWLDTFADNWKNIVKLRRTDKTIYIIEKDTIDNELYLINVVYIEEIE